jgi:hypothetical protein
MSTTDTEQWTPVYSKWRHGGWYVNNVRHPSGGVGCVSRNYPDGKWRVVCDARPDAYEKHTYKTRDAAARAERELAEAERGLAASAQLDAAVAAAALLTPEALADAARNTRELDDDEPLNDNPKADPCQVCGNAPTDGTSGAGERLCAECAANDQSHGEDITWDADAPQEAMSTPVQCGYCGCVVKFTPSGIWTLDGTDSMSDQSQRHCDESPDRKHDPAYEDTGPDTTEYYRCSCGNDVVDSERDAHERGCSGREVLSFHGADNSPSTSLPVSEDSANADAYASIVGAVDCYRAGGAISTAEAAQLASLLTDMRYRDDAWSRMVAEHNTAHSRLWTAVEAAAASHGQKAAPASLLAFLAWQRDDMPAMSEALRRAMTEVPRYPMAALLMNVFASGAPACMARLPMRPDEVAGAYDALDAQKRA